MFYIISDESNLDVQRLSIAFAYRKQADVSHANCYCHIWLITQEALMARSVDNRTRLTQHTYSQAAIAHWVLDEIIYGVL